MKSLRKSLVAILMVAMLLITSLPVFAADIPAGNGSITVNKSTADPAATLKGRSLEAWQLFSATYAPDGQSAVYAMSDDQWAVAKAITGVTGLTVDTTSKEATLKSIREWLSPAPPAAQRSADELQQFAQAVVKANNGDQLPKKSLTVDANGDKATLTGIELGYYMVVDKTTNDDIAEGDTKALIALTNAKPDGTVDLKAKHIPFDKKIDNTPQGDASPKGNDPSSESSKLVYDNHSIGDVIKYELTSKVPDMTGYTQYYFGFKDTLAKGLKYKEDIVVTVDGNQLTKGTDYDVEYTNGNGTAESTINVYFKDFYNNYKDKAGKDIVVTYNAEVTKDAEIGTAGNENKAHVWFKRDPNEGGDEDNPDNPSGKTPEKHTKSFVTEFVLHKTDETGAKLAGATFELSGDRVNTVLVTGEEYIKIGGNVPAGYTESDPGPFYKLTDGTYTKEAPKAGNEDKYDSTTDQYKLYSFEKFVQDGSANHKVTLTTGPDGKLVFTGLGAGEYTLKETKAPAGYNVVGDMKIRITCTPGDDAKTGTGQQNCTWKYEYKTADGTDYKEFPTAREVGPINELTVKNTSNTLLPETGGIGTTLFYILGSLLALIALVVLVSKKRVLASRG